MSFVSYAQNFEDVMLWRALKHIEKGFYVDVGAQHPVNESVSKAFYERGWRGIHIEPVPQFAELLRKDRPDETVLQVALGDADGTLDLNVIPDTGLSTFVDAYAQRYNVEEGYKHERIQVPVLTLKSALSSLAGKEVHWLKIDVEGFEEKVLKGWDSKTFRPWVMVVEATIPLSPETDYTTWDPILTAAKYQFVYFDGLNRFYVSKEHADLAEAFSCPPNFFDDVVLSSSSYLCRELITSHQAREKELVMRAENLAAEHTTRLQLHAQWLQNEWDAERQRTVQLGADLQGARKHESQLQAHAQWLQNEWDAAKHRLEELSRRNGRLEGDLESERQRTVQLGADLQGARKHESQLQAHAQWLQNEWDAAKVKIDELDQSSHHWWTVADQLSLELQGVYASKSWRITWPLRKTMQGIKCLLALAMRTVHKALRLPKHIAKSLIVWAISQTLSNPHLKSRALEVLAKHPWLKHRLRQLAIRAGLITSWEAATPTSHELRRGSEPETTDAIPYSPNTPEESIQNLSPRAARIYADLKRAVEASER